MTPEEKQHQINRAILTVLARAGSYLTPEPTLQQEVDIWLGRTQLASDFNRSLRDLEARQLITGIEPALGGPVRWRLTDAGYSHAPH